MRNDLGKLQQTKSDESGWRAVDAFAWIEGIPMPVSIIVNNAAVLYPGSLIAESIIDADGVVFGGFRGKIGFAEIHHEADSFRGLCVKKGV